MEKRAISPREHFAETWRQEATSVGVVAKVIIYTETLSGLVMGAPRGQD